MAITTCRNCGSLTPATVVRCGNCGAPLGALAPTGMAGGYAPPGQDWGGPQREHPDGTTVLVLGILSLVACSLCGPIAWAKGNTAIREIDARPGQYSNRGTVQAGRIMGMITSCLLLVAVVVGIVAAIVVFAVGSTTTNQPGSGGTGTLSRACATELRTLKTATEAYNAQNGRYPASEAELVPDFLVEEAPNYDLEGPGGDVRPQFVPSGTECS